MNHKLLIGTDEAGYGPNLGPLVITATAWKLPVDVDSESLWEHFTDVLTNQPRVNDRRLFIADSKEVYSPASGLLDLETGVLSFLSTLGMLPETSAALGTALAGEPFALALQQEPTADAPQCTLPVAAVPEEIQEYGQSLQKACRETGIVLEQVRSRILFPTEFNSLVTLAESKGVVLSTSTLQLVRDVCPAWMRSGHRNEESDPVSIHVICDKHGGRNRYDEVIAEAFGDQFVFRVQESAALSRYRMGHAEFCFRTKAEQFLPVALASMVSKYLREVLMISFNSFWVRHLPGLRPTKGYPLDARRFRDEIAETARQLGIGEDRFWRVR